MQPEKALRVVLDSLHLHLPTWKSYVQTMLRLENTGVKFFLSDRKKTAPTSRCTVTHQKRQVQEAGCLYYG